MRWRSKKSLNSSIQNVTKVLNIIFSYNNKAVSGGATSIQLIPGKSKFDTVLPSQGQGQGREGLSSEVSSPEAKSPQPLKASDIPVKVYRSPAYIMDALEMMRL